MVLETFLNIGLTKYIVDTEFGNEQKYYYHFDSIMYFHDCDKLNFELKIAINKRQCRSVVFHLHLDALSHMCQTQAHGPNLVRNVIMLGPRDHIQCASELARGLCYIFDFKFNFSCVCNIKILLLQVLCLSTIKVYSIWKC